MAVTERQIEEATYVLGLLQQAKTVMELYGLSAVDQARYRRLSTEIFGMEADLNVDASVIREELFGDSVFRRAAATDSTG